MVRREGGGVGGKCPPEIGVSGGLFQQLGEQVEGQVAVRMCLDVLPALAIGSEQGVPLLVEGVERASFQPVVVRAAADADRLSGHEHQRVVAFRPFRGQGDLLRKGVRRRCVGECAVVHHQCVRVGHALARRHQRIAGHYQCVVACVRQGAADGGGFP